MSGCKPNKEDYDGFVYLWFDTKHRKYIIGSHKGHVDDGYTTSTGGIHVQRIFNCRPDTMKRRILSYVKGTVKDIRKEEQRFLDLRPNIINNEKYYNRNNSAVGGVGGWDHVNNDPNRENPMSRKDVRKKHLAKMKSLSGKGHFKPKYGNDNPMRNPEICSKHPALFTSENNPMNDPEMRAKAREKQKKKRVSIAGILYEGLNIAAEILGTSRQAIKHRCNSKNFPDHFIVEDTQ